MWLYTSRNLLKVNFNLERVQKELRARPHQRVLDRNRCRSRSTRTPQTGWEGYDGPPGGAVTEATHDRFVLESHRVHPYFSVPAHIPRAARHRILRGAGHLRRSTDGTSQAEYQALQMEEATAIDTELRELQFG